MVRRKPPKKRVVKQAKAEIATAITEASNLRKYHASMVTVLDTILQYLKTQRGN